MIYIFKRLVVLNIVILTAFSCSSDNTKIGGSEDEDNGDNKGAVVDESPIINDPKAATLVFPLKDVECNEGAIVSNQESEVTFKWSASEFTDSYSVSLRNLNSDELSTVNTDTNSAPILLKRGVPYSWKIISKSSKSSKTAESETWKLYNAGEGEENYAPFPVELVRPEMGVNVATAVSLEWIGSDVDNDIKEYVVYVSKTNPPTELVKTIKATTLSLNLDANTVYYWKVITRDTNGAATESSVFDFKTN